MTMPGLLASELEAVAATGAIVPADAGPASAARAGVVENGIMATARWMAMEGRFMFV
jgi:hypothetical protein